MAGENLSYAKTHEWIEASGKVRKVGISAFAANQLSDIVYVEFPQAGKIVKAGEEACLVESCKATSGVYAPLSGKIVAFNTSLTNAPELINQSPFAEGWLFKLEVEEGADEAALLDFAAYQQFVSEQL